MNHDVEQLRARGTGFAARRQWAQAAACFEQVVDAAPGDAAARLRLADALARAGHYRRAHAATLAALAAAPREPAQMLELARLLRHFYEVRALVDFVADAGFAVVERPAVELVEVADVLATVDAHEPALALLDLAAQRDPSYAPAHYLRGTTLMFLGRVDEAEPALECALALAPHFAHAHWRLSQLRRHTPERNHVARLEAERARVAADSEHDIHFSFALHAELHDLGRYDEAWEALMRGCRAKRAALRYDPADSRRLFAAVEALCAEDFIRRDEHAAIADDGAVPIFIVGMFRSGTTLLERILGGHSQVTDGGETLGFTAQMHLAADRRDRDALDIETVRRAAAFDWRALGEDFLRASRWRARGRRFWTEKLPSNFLNLGFIARAVPRARFLHMARAPLDVCFSNLRLLYGDICRYSYDQRELADYYLGYDRLMQHWRTVVGERLLDVSYDALVRDPEGQTRRVMAFCGLDFEPQALAIEARGGAVSTASSTQVREGIRAPGAPAWTPYRARLRPLIDALVDGGATPAA